MPNAHNGYYDTLLELGYPGFVLLIAFILTTLHGIGRVTDRAPVRAWILLSLAFFVIIYNGLESTWMRGYEFEWVVFLTVAAETARYCQSVRIAGRAPSRGLPHAAKVAGPSHGVRGRSVDASAGQVAAMPQGD